MLLAYTTLAYYGPGAASMTADPGVGDMAMAEPRQTKRCAVTAVGAGAAPLLRCYRGYGADLDASGGASQVVTPHQKMGVKLMVAVGAVPSAADIAQAIWNANAPTYNYANTMGNKVNAAGSGGVDIGALAQAVWEYTARTLSANAAAPSKEEVAATVLAQLQATTIPVNLTQIKGQPFGGDGTEADPWGP